MVKSNKYFFGVINMTNISAGKTPAVVAAQDSQS